MPITREFDSVESQHKMRKLVGTESRALNLHSNKGTFTYCHDLNFQRTLKNIKPLSV